MTDLVFVNNDELEHYGVKGMKWGVRRSANKASRTERRIAQGNRRLESSGGSAGKAYAKVAVGNHIKSVLIGSAGILATQALGNTPQVKSGVKFVTDMAAIGVLAQDVNTATKIYQAKKASER